AITVVGKVCTLSEKFDWFSEKPLKGSTVVVTRPKDRIGTIADRLREQGADVIEYPCIETEMIIDNPQFDAAMNRIGTYQWLVFTSPIGVETFFEKLKQKKLDIRMLFGLKIAAVGRETRKRLQDRNLTVDYMPDIYDSPNLSQGLISQIKNDGSQDVKVLIMRANLGTNILTETLKEHSVAYDDVHIYETNYTSNEAGAVRAKIESGMVNYVTFTSASTVKGFVESIKKEDADFDFTRVTAVCIGEQTAKEAGKYAMRINVSREASMDSMIEEIEILSKIESNRPI
ncbi:MAG: uroporphyrinogen-III synthase, partial [Proteocatella sp.]